MNGKRWHENDDLPDKIKGLLSRSLLLIEISTAESGLLWAHVNG
jgi:hypothetical protein